MRRFEAPIQDQYGYPAQSHHVKEMIGIPRKKKLPADGQGPVLVQGYYIVVISLKEAKERKLFHRVRTCCPKCLADVSVGRIAQHRCGEVTK